MQRNQDSEFNELTDTPTNISRNKRRCLSYWDSGLGKESSSGFENDVSMYEQESPIGHHDTDTRDSGCDHEEFTLETVLQKTPWLSNEESVDFTNVDVNTNTELPTEFETLISGSFVREKELPSSSGFRRSLSLIDEDKTAKVPFSRIESPSEFKSSKRSKAASPMFQRSLSYDEENIKHALQRSSVEPDLIGDFSQPCHLPLTSGRHQDLKCITATTLASLVKGKYESTLMSYKIIDCRFPYEFDGGHISGAINLYTKDQIVDMLNECEHLNQILIFHCEFSSERGPTLYRFLRKLDRNRNEYPKLNYPEMYLLEGGYKKFYEQYSDLCEPKAYKPMFHPEHQAELRLFKAQSKSFNEDRLRPNNTGSFKRLGFL